MPRTATNPVKSTIQTLEILGAVKDLHGGTVTELADHLDLPKSNVHNYVSTLHQEGYLVRDGNTYHIGLRFFELGAHARNRLKIYHIARPEVEKLAQKTGELANLLVEEHGLGSYLCRVRGDEAVQVEAHAGTRVHLHNTALGKSILAHLPEERVGEILDQHGLPGRSPTTITDRGELFDELERVRERGFAQDDEERLQGLRCVAAPIRSNDDRVLGAISISGPTTRLDEEQFNEVLPKDVLEAVNVIELNVTYS